MTNGERIAAELRRAWNGAPWHGPSAAEVIGRLTAQQAASRRTRGSHTPWQLVLHLTTWVETPLRRLDDPSYEPAAGDDFPEASATSSEQWRADVAALGARLDLLAQRVALMPDETLAAPVGARGYTCTTMLDGVVQHLAYHAGQVAILARPREEVVKLLAPAPFIPLGAVVLAELIRRVYDLQFAPPRFLGWALIAIGAALAYWGHEHFVARRTPAVPWKAPRALVLDGPYRFTRNPMYIGFLMIQAGIGCVRHNPLYLILLVPSWALLHWGVVLREERYLLRRFGASYQQLLDTTRRWLL